MKNKQLQSYQNQKQIISVEYKDHNEVTKFYGYVLWFSKKLLFLQLDRDFSFDGYCILKRKNIINIRYTKNDAFYTKLHSQNFPLWYDKKLDITNIHSTFQSLEQNNEHSILECNTLDPDFYIWPITKVGKNSLHIHYYNSRAKFDTHPTKIPFKYISIIKFGDKYVKVFQKYIEKK